MQTRKKEREKKTTKKQKKNGATRRCTIAINPARVMARRTTVNNTTPICIKCLSHAFIVRNFSLPHRRTMKYLLISCVDRDRQFVNGAFLARFMLIYARGTKDCEMEIIFLYAYIFFMYDCLAFGLALLLLLYDFRRYCCYR